MPNIQEIFNESLKEYFERPDALTQSLVAKISGMHRSQMSMLVRQERGTSEDNRRAIAAAIGIPYDEMIGLPAAPPSFWKKVFSDGQEILSLPLSGDNIEAILSAWPRQTKNMVVVPVVRLEVVLAGVDIAGDDVLGWETIFYHPPYSGLVAVQLDQSPFGSRVRAATIAVVDREQQDIVDGGFYLLRAPSRFTVQRAYQHKDTVVLLSCHIDDMAPQIIDSRHGAEFIVGRVVFAHQRLL